MSYLLEVAWAVLQPSNTLIGTLILSAVLFWIGRRKWGQGLFIASTSAILAVTFLPVTSLLYVPLETRFETPELPENTDGIIVLGGAVSPTLTAKWGQPSLSRGAERMTEAVGLARHYPQTKIFFTGGPWSEDGMTEAEVGRRFFAQQGIAEDRLILEAKASSTYENAVFTRELVEPKADQIWILVTSAAHMPRAVGAFRKQGWKILPYPVDFEFRGITWLAWPPDTGRALADFDFVIREWVALTWYRLAGRTDSFLPAQNQPSQ